MPVRQSVEGLMPTDPLDMNVVSFALKGDPRVELYAPQLQGCKMALSFMTVAELFQWAAVRKWGPRRVDRFREALEQYIFLPVDIESRSPWGEIREKCRAKGHPISPRGAWIAATARRFRLPLATHNPADFEIVDGLGILTALI